MAGVLLDEGLRARERLAKVEGRLEESHRHVATREDVQAVRTELVGVRSDLKAEIAGVQAALQEDVQAVRTELVGVQATLQSEIADVRVDVQSVRTELADVQAALQSEIADVRVDVQSVRTELADVQAALQSEIAGVQATLKEDRADVQSDMRVLRIWMFVGVLVLAFLDDINLIDVLLQLRRLGGG